MISLGIAFAKRRTEIFGTHSFSFNFIKIWPVADLIFVLWPVNWKRA
jgi:hypothetical protein